ncbi:hypothetical protein FAZ15_04580 [Sphingobacterium olei]|uniref:Lipoprotein n=1 Tax=Sphingobacterium olei TaxID=2571155 RepID=A0A4V5MMQ6_9SPHI|nr:hypothetical protein [Sphingobacterium olei]TJZ61798.1 hypothetical protein FAZ15_04580 [Sphingobacterium olei]
MKTRLILFAIIILISSCMKMNSDYELVDDPKLEKFESSKVEVNINSEFEKVSNLLFSKLKNNTLALSEFQDSINVLKKEFLTELKIKAGPKKGIAFSKSSFSFIPPPCPYFGLDTVLCPQFILEECYMYCENDYYRSIDSYWYDELSAEYELNVALAACNNIPPGYSRTQCISSAQSAFGAAMNAIYQGYMLAQEQWRQCDQFCINSYPAVQ